MKRIHPDDIGSDRLIAWCKANSIDPLRVEFNDVTFPSTTPRVRYREVLVNHDGEDVVAGRRPDGSPVFAKGDWIEVPMLATPDEFGLRVI